jgi:hypothetical protein
MSLSELKSSSDDTSDPQGIDGDLVNMGTIRVAVCTAVEIKKIKRRPVMNSALWTKVELSKKLLNGKELKQTITYGSTRDVTALANAWEIRRSGQGFR